MQKQFSEAQESRLREYAEETKTRRETFEKHEEENFEVFEASQGDRDSGFKEVLEKAQASSAALLATIEAHRDRAQELLFVIANTGMVGGYQKVANTKRQAAKVWQWIAAGAFLGLISFAIVAFAGTVSPEFAWPRFAARAFVAVTFGLLAAYAARQADRFDAAEAQNRRTELALASLQPFLVGVPESDQHELKKQLAVRFFGPEPPQETSPQAAPIKGNAADLLRLALQTASDLAKHK